MRDDFSNTASPDLNTVASIYPLSSFTVQYWTGSTWATVQNGNVVGNNRVWKQISFSSVTTTRIRILVNAAASDGYSRIVEVEAWGGQSSAPSPSPTPTVAPNPSPSPAATPVASPTPTPIASPTPVIRTNVALASNGGNASASSALGAPALAIDGIKSWALSGSWKDSTAFGYPDWIQVDFNGTKSIDEIDIYGVRDDYLNTAVPTDSTVSTVYGLINFEVQYWNGAAWVTVPGGNISGNNFVLKKIAFSPISTSRIRVSVTSAQDGFSRVVELEAWTGSGGSGNTAPSPTPTVNPSPSPIPTPAPSPSPTPSVRTNYARATNGASATASSQLNPASAAIDGSLVWAIGGAWKDSSPSGYPDWLQVDFAGSRTIDEINVYGVMDDYLSVVPPTASTTGSIYGLTTFEVQYWNGSGWSTIPGGSITGNNRVLRKFTFSPITTSRIRVVVNGAQDGFSRVVELEAWGG